nr:MAG TPA: Integrin alpha-1 Alpha1, Transmembrane Region, Detergent [Caudoviricetes sp.]
MISLWHLVWIVPVCVFAGLLLAALLRSNDR